MIWYPLYLWSCHTWLLVITVHYLVVKYIGSFLTYGIMYVIVMHDTCKLTHKNSIKSWLFTWRNRLGYPAQPGLASRQIKFIIHALFFGRRPQSSREVAKGREAEVEHAAGGAQSAMAPPWFSDELWAGDACRGHLFFILT